MRNECLSMCMSVRECLSGMRLTCANAAAASRSAAASKRPAQKRTFSMDLDDVGCLEGEMEASHAILWTRGVDEENGVYHVGDDICPTVGWSLLRS